MGTVTYNFGIGYSDYKYRCAMNNYIIVLKRYV